MSEPGHRRWIPGQVAHRGEGPRRRHLEGRRGRQAGTDRNIAGDYSLPTPQFVFRLHQRPRRPFHILEPALPSRRGPGSSHLLQVKFAFRVELVAVDPHGRALGRSEGDPHGVVNRHGQHEAIVVVGVFADQVHAPWRSHKLGRSGPEALLEGRFRGTTGISIAHEQLRGEGVRSMPRQAVKLRRIPAKPLEGTVPAYRC